MRKALLFLCLLSVGWLLPHTARAGEGKEVLFFLWLAAAAALAVVYGVVLLLAAVVTRRDTLRGFWWSCLALAALIAGAQLLSAPAAPTDLYRAGLFWGPLVPAFFLGLTVKLLRLNPPEETG